MFKWKIAANIAAASLLVGALGYYNFIDKAAEPGAQKGDKCPEITAQLYKTEGDTFSLSEETFSISQQIGKVCVLNFWETWCQGCIKELHEFNEFYEAYEGKVEVIAVVGKTSPPEQAADWLNKKSWQTLDPDHDWADFSLKFAYLPAEACDSLGCEDGMLPRTVIVDKSGYITYSEALPLTFEGLQELVEPLL